MEYEIDNRNTTRYNTFEVELQHAPASSEAAHRFYWDAQKKQYGEKGFAAELDSRVGREAVCQLLREVNGLENLRVCRRRRASDKWRVAAAVALCLAGLAGAALFAARLGFEYPTVATALFMMSFALPARLVLTAARNTATYNLRLRHERNQSVLEVLARHQRSVFADLPVAVTLSSQGSYISLLLRPEPGKLSGGEPEPGQAPLLWSTASLA